MADSYAAVPVLYRFGSGDNGLFEGPVVLNAWKRVRTYNLDNRYFCPEDLSAMRHAYCTACSESPYAVRTDHQRMMLAKAIVVVFDSTLPETAIVDAAWLVASNSYA